MMMPGIESLLFFSLSLLIQGARWVPASALGKATRFGKLGETAAPDLAHDVALDTKISYGPAGRATVTLATTVKVLMAHIPLRIDIRLVEIAGAARLGLTKSQSFASFLSEPLTIFEVRFSSSSNTATILMNIFVSISSPFQRCRCNHQGTLDRGR